MRLLAMDTATEALSVALMDAGLVVAHRFEVIGRGHAERILPWVREAAEQVGWKLSTLDAVAVGRGPGAFTGVRIGISTAQGLAYGLGVPVVGVSDLLAVAVGAQSRLAATGAEADAVLVALDARMGEVYAAAGRVVEGAVILEWEALCRPEDLAGRVAGMGTVLLAGHGFAAYPAVATGWVSAVACYSDQLPDAAVIARLGDKALREGAGVDPAALEPVYLRDDVATRSTRPVHMSLI